MASWVKNKNEELGKNNLKGERKKEENYTITGGEGLKNASFWAINSIELYIPVIARKPPLIHFEPATK